MAEEGRVGSEGGAAAWSDELLRGPAEPRGDDASSDAAATGTGVARAAQAQTAEAASPSASPMSPRSEEDDDASSYTSSSLVAASTAGAIDRVLDLFAAKDEAQRCGIEEGQLSELRRQIACHTQLCAQVTQA
jgi:hypothetical protein|eukprot:COSAG01_NODE_259_length_20069_cov_21.507762_3_plen_133_part_00